MKKHIGALFTVLTMLFLSGCVYEEYAEIRVNVDSTSGEVVCSSNCGINGRYDTPQSFRVTVDSDKFIQFDGDGGFVTVHITGDGIDQYHSGTEFVISINQ